MTVTTATDTTTTATTMTVTVAMPSSTQTGQGEGKQVIDLGADLNNLIREQVRIALENTLPKNQGVTTQGS